MSGIKIAFGGGLIGRPQGFKTHAEVEEVLDVLKASGIKIIDTAQLYGESEKFLGEAGAASHFTIDTKHAGGLVSGESSKEKVIARAKSSLERLKTNKVDIFYIHAPDREVDMADTLAGIQAVFEAGMFERFGLSNYHAHEVEAVYTHCKEKGYVLPSVYQGNYNPVARKQEQLLFPTLRKLGMSFYAYSPLAGGFLTKSKSQVEEGAGRFDTSTPIGNMYSGMYSRPDLLESLAQWEAAAAAEGCSRADLAYRWVRFNSPLKPELGDCMIVGARTVNQLKQTLQGMNAGPLKEDTLKRIDGIWDLVKDSAPLDNMNG